MGPIEYYTPFSDVYASFLSKITDDMYMQLTPEDTYNILQQLLLSALPKFEFPRKSLDFEEIQWRDENDNPFSEWVFIDKLTNEEINIISTYMIVEWIGQQLASVQNVRMKYSGSDFKFTSQANHMQKLLQLKKDYEREGFHLQRLYKRRRRDEHGIYRSTFGQIMEKPKPRNFGKDVFRPPLPTAPPPAPPNMCDCGPSLELTIDDDTLAFTEIPHGKDNKDK